MTKSFIITSSILLLTACNNAELIKSPEEIEINSDRTEKEIIIKEETETKPETTSTTSEKSTKEKLIALTYAQTKVDPENFYYPGCNISHGEDGKVDNWDNFSETKLQNTLTFLSQATKQHKVVLMDYSRNPYNMSDNIGIVTCDCEAFNALDQAIAKSQLHFSYILWHAKDRNNIENEVMYPCLQPKMSF